MTFIDVKRNGGPTAPTLAKAEAGELDDPRPSTLSKFDVGLRWHAGSAASTYWDGDEPRPRDHSSGGMAALEPTAGSVSLPLDQILALMRAQGQLNDVADQSGKTVALSQLRPLIQALNDGVSSIVGVFVTDMLERNHSRSSALQPLLEYAFAELLSAPVSPEDPDRDEKSYRRWLLGNTDGISKKLQASFEDRLHRRAMQHEEGDDDR